MFKRKKKMVKWNYDYQIVVPGSVYRFWVQASPKTKMHTHIHTHHTHARARALKKLLRNAPKMRIKFKFQRGKPAFQQTFLCRLQGGQNQVEAILAPPPAWELGEETRLLSPRPFPHWGTRPANAPGMSRYNRDEPRLRTTSLTVSIDWTLKMFYAASHQHLSIHRTEVSQLS